MPIPSEPYAGIYAPTKSEILDILTKWIVEMQLESEEKIFDTEIAAYFRVSRTPVREVLQTLERQKLVSIYPAKATVVTKLGIENPEQLYLPMQTLQCLAVRLAVEQVKEEDIAALEKINAEFARQSARPTDAMKLLKLDEEFHDTILSIAGYEYVSDFCSTLMVHIARLDYLFFKETQQLKSSYEDHVRIIEGLKLKDTTSAELAMKNNWINSMLEVKAKIGKFADGKATPSR